MGPYRQLQRAGARGRIAGSKIIQELIEEFGSVVGVVALERERRSAKAGDRLRCRPLEQQLGFYKAALAEPQLTEPRHRRSGHRRTNLLQLARGGGELALGIVPFAAPNEDARELE